MLYQLSYALKPHFKVSTFGGGDAVSAAERSWIAAKSAERLRVEGQCAEEGWLRDL